MIRLATLGDLNQIINIINKIKVEMKETENPQWSEENDYPNIDIFKEDINNNTLYVFEEEKVIKGLICIDHTNRNYKNKPDFNKKEDCYTINRVAVDSAYRIQNIAIKLMEFAEKKALDNKKYLLKSSTEKRNVKMHNLFMKLGYIQKEQFSYIDYPGEYYSYEKNLGSDINV